MKPSRYNHFATLPDGISLLFNTFSLALLALNAGERDCVESVLHRPDDRQSHLGRWRRVLVEQGFLVDDEADERALLQKSHLEARRSTRHLGLTIAPSLACNFACVYCYQSERGPVMGPEVEEAVVRFVASTAEEGGTLSVTWFGGEPLLHLSALERLSRRFMAICDTTGVQYSSNIITNGYLLDKETAKKLSRLRVSRVQVTLDGPRRIHDRRRTLRRGGKTFQAIWDNVEQACEVMPVSLRMNADEQNRQDILTLVDQLAGAGLEKKVHFYLGRTYPYTAACRDVSGWCLSDEDFSLLELETAIEMLERGFVSFRMPRHRSFYCLADSESSFVIGPRGGLFKCWNEIDHRGAEVGHLLQPTTAAMRSNRKRWRSRDPFELECANCGLLPICMGGCPYLYSVTGELHCHAWKHHMSEYLAFHHCLKQMKREGEIVRKFQDVVSTVRRLYRAGDPGRAE